MCDTCRQARGSHSRGWDGGSPCGSRQAEPPNPVLRAEQETASAIRPQCREGWAPQAFSSEGRTRSAECSGNIET